MNANICLVMIVKDEEDVIARAVISALPFISSWLVIDTGSTDNTKFIIQTVLAGISGEIIDRPWVNFGHNRTEALQLCRDRQCSDWAIMLDADDNLAGTVPPSSIWSNTTLDGFIMQIHHGSIVHQRVHIFRLAADWVYEGVIHEYPRCRSRENPVLGVLPPETFMETRCEGARSKDPNKYLKDAALLEMEILREPTNGRTLFYLAQSYRDAGRSHEAQRYYKLHADLSGAWTQETYMSLVNLIGLGSNVEELMALGWRALEICPDRLEAPYFLMNRLRLLGYKPTHQLFALGSVMKARKASRTALFVNTAVYDWGFDDEFAVVAFATGHYTESYAASTRCAINAPVAEMRENAFKNLKVTQELLNQQA